MVPRRFRITLAPGLLLTLLVAAVLAGCGASAAGGGGLYGGGGASNGGATPATGAGQTTCASSSAPICTRSVQVTGTAKQALVTPDGKTLYYFTSDTATTSACSGGCVATWPPLLTSSTSGAPIAGLTGTLATLSRSGGTQVVYNGHPLYTFSGDQAPGDAKGEGFMGKWFVATSDLAPAPGSNDNNGYNDGY